MYYEYVVIHGFYLCVGPVLVMSLILCCMLYATLRDPYGSVMCRYVIPNRIFYMKMKIYKPLHSYPPLTC